MGHPSYVDQQANVVVGRVLREMREDAGMTQERVAEALGFSHAALGMWERGERTLEIAKASVLCAVYGVPLVWFMEVVERRVKEAA